MSDKERTLELLARQSIMVISVVLENGTPWATPVKVQAYDDRGFEWDSRIDTVHSRAIEHNPAVAITIFEKLEDSQFGFYAKGTTKIAEKKGEEYARYRFEIEQAWVNDETFVKREIIL